MKLNNKGFAISGVIYAIMFLFIILIFAILGLLGTRKIILDKYKKEVADNIEGNVSTLNASKIDKSGASAPELTKGMIPVIYNGVNWVKAEYKSEYDQDWYNYEQKKWANVILVREEVRLTYQNANAGYNINMSDVLAFYVWIPRYKYKLFNAEANLLCSSISGLNTTYNPAHASCYSGDTVATYVGTNYTYGGVNEQQIDIVFENNMIAKSNGNLNDEYLTHPAFTFGSKELNGLWVGKFETTGAIGDLSILPNSSPIVRQTLSSMFYASRDMEASNNIYGLDSDEVDTHMMKNIEWGAVAYLTQSRYGKCNNGTCSEVGINNYYNSGLKTGCGNIAGSSITTTCNDYTNALGSTTGTIYGIYDMAGGAREYVAGNMKDENGNFYSSSAGFSTSPESKYYNTYTYDDSDLNHLRGLLGDATKETLKIYGNANGGWYSNSTVFPYDNRAWFTRGNSCEDANIGIFSFGRSTGGGNSDYSSFRQIITNDY